MLKTFTYSKCIQCGFHYQPCDWLPWRECEFCSESCAESFAQAMGEREIVPEEASPQIDLFNSTDLGVSNGL